MTKIKYSVCGQSQELENRVRQYFYNNAQTEKTLVLVSKIKDINYIVTPTEYDALILENNLIKEHKPPYNILLKDDKTYPYIKIVTKSDYPTLEITRKLKADGARYFGPYMLGISVSEIIKLIQSAFPVRTCKTQAFIEPKGMFELSYRRSCPARQSVQRGIRQNYR